MKYIYQLFVYSLFSIGCLAHPGIGIVKDSKGNLYYTDLKQVWKISADGNKNVVVPGVHTHELYIDAADNLYGEHLWYNGERLNTWGHYVWCLKNDGSLVKEIESTEGFLSNYSFARDSAGNMYWVERFTVSRFKKKTPGGEVTTIAEGKFKEIRWMHCTNEGTVYFVDWHDLYKIDRQGKVTLLAKNLAENTISFGIINDGRHSIMGIWTDKADNVYVAVLSGQVVKRIAPDGQVKIIEHSTSPWSVTNGLFDNAGNLWLLEYSLSNEARIRKVKKEDLNKSGQSKAYLANNIIPLAIGAGIVSLIALFLKKLYMKKKRIQ